MIWFLWIDRVIQKEGLYVYNSHNIVEKHFSISIAHVRSWGGLLVFNQFRFSNITNNIVIKIYLTMFRILFNRMVTLRKVFIKD
jgi:hypothetical protein